MTTEKESSNDVKIIRLNTGEDIICSCIFDDAVLVQNPIRVSISRVNPQGKTMMLLSPWLPVEIIEEDVSMISYDNIITVVNPKQEFVEYYLNYVEQFKEIINETELRDSNIDDDEHDDDEEESKFIEELMNTIKDIKKNTIH
jgi:hypothetical protein